MRVLICGATGNIGRLTTDKALKAGHEVTAFTRSPQKLENKEHLHKVQGDVMDADSVTAAMANQDVVLAVFGAPPNWTNITSVPDLCTVGTRNIMDAMKQHGVKRLVCMTGIGAGDSKGHGRFIFDNLILPIMLGRIYVDKNRQEKEVMASDLDWIVVRPTELTNDAESDSYRVLTNLKGEKAKTIARADVADFLVKQIESDTDLGTINRLSQDFATELATLKGRVDNLEDRVATLEDNQFSTTTKLKGQAIFAVNAGGFTGDRIIDPNGDLLTESQPEATFLYRTNLDFDTSFTGTDNLKIRIDTGSNGFNDNAANFLEPNFGSILNYSDSPPRDGDIGVGRVYYSFKPAETLQVAIGPAMVATDYIDFSQYTRPSFRGISTESLAQNYLLFPIEGPSGGTYSSWTFKDKFTIRATYNAAEAGNPNEDLSGIIQGLSTFTALLYPGAEGDGGLFGDFYQGIVELEYAPIETVAVRLQYSGGEVFDRRFDVLGVNAEWQFLSRFAVFGRYSYGNYDDTAFGDIEPNYWMAGVSVNDLLKEGATLGIAARQPFVASEIGNDTQTNFEAYYNYPLNDFIAVSPILQVITNASNQDANDTIYTGTIRTVFKF